MGRSRDGTEGGDANAVTAAAGAASDATSGSTTQAVIATPQTQAEQLDRDQRAIQQALERLAIRLELELPRGCGSTAAFVERLLARLDRIHVAESAPKRTVQARIATKPNGTFRATMKLLYPDGHSASRVVDANHCDDAIDALALITAVTLDPTSVSEVGTEPATNTTGPAPNATTAPVSEPDPQPAKAHHASAAPVSSHVQRTSPARAVQADAATRSATRVGFGIGFVGLRGPAPGWMNGLELSTRIVQTGHSGFAPSVRLSLAYAARRNVTAAGGIADFSLLSSRLEFCPWQLVSSRTEIRGCGVAHGGLVTARGRATLEPEAHRRPFFALGAGLEVLLLPADWLGIAFQLHGVAPTARDTYAFDPAAFYRVSRISFDVTAGLETRFR
ncbi:MAG TPA: hypothetical protein VKP30_07615 [Polyangiaceae bacterium]|nr:hypothetical protein [Polyangiaceae bacterium]